MTRRLGLVALGLGLAWACGDDEKPPPPSHSTPNAGQGGEAGEGTSGSGVGGSSSGGTAGRGGGGQGGSGQGGMPSGAGGEDDPTGGAGEGGEAGDSGVPRCPSDEAEVPTSLGSVCDPEGTWGPAMDVSITGNAARLVSVTPDELTMTWLAQSFIGESYWVVDRAAVTDSFEGGQELFDMIVVALSPDGLRVVALTPDRTELSELTRTARSEMFGAPSSDAFASLNANAASNDLVYSTVVISPDDETLYYSVLGSADGEFPVYVSTRTGTGPWPVGQPMQACELMTLGTSARVPTGISSDGLTLFYFDQARGVARASWRESVTGPFVWSTNLGERNLAQPNAACRRLYFTLTTGPSFSDPL